MITKIVLLSGIFTLLIYGSVLAHEGLHEQIAAASKQIHEDPKNADLYLKRGELFRFHHEWSKALADYATASRLNPRLEAVEYCRAMLDSDRGNDRGAKRHFDDFLASHPDHVAALVGRARVLVRMRQYQAAILDYTRAIEKSPEPQPEDYIERSNAAMAQGPGGAEEALRGFDQGIGRLGPIVTLELPAIDLELKRKNYDGALARIDTITAQSERKESWLLKRGQVLRSAGRNQQAREAFESALAAWQSLPDSIKETRAGRELEMQIQTELSSPQR